MYNYTSRLNAIGTYAILALIFYGALTHISSFPLKENPTVTSFKINKFIQLQKYDQPRPFEPYVHDSNGHPQPRYYLPAGDEAIFTFDLLADLRPLWTYNSKIFFVYLTAEYKNDRHVTNQVVFWDKIISSKEECNIRLRNEPPEYGVQDHGFFLRYPQALDLTLSKSCGRLLFRGANLTLTMTVNELPHTGALLWSTPSTYTYTLPKQYTRATTQ